MDLVLDIGNSRTKLGLFGPLGLERTGVVANGDLEGIRTFLGGGAVQHIVLGSVAKDDPALLEGLGTLASVLVVDGTTLTPLTNKYDTPNTLGADRLANAVGANRMFPGRAVLVIDPGTCITYDLVDAQGTYLGGAISPGMQMRSRAMNTYSARLPQVTPDQATPMIGRSTMECLSSGVHHGVRLELIGFIQAFRQQHPTLAVVLTGGDAPRFARALENGIFAHPFLTLLGLHAILEHHSSSGGAAAVAG